MSTSGAAKLRAPGAESASPRSASPHSAPSRAQRPTGEDRRLRPYERGPRGNPPLERADLARGEEKLSRILGW